MHGQPFTLKGPDGAGRVLLGGDLNAFTAPRGSLAGMLVKSGNKEITFDMSGLVGLDLNGAAILMDLEKTLGDLGVRVSFEGVPEEEKEIWELARDTSAKIPDTSPPAPLGFIPATGKMIMDFLKDGYELTMFFGEVVIDGIGLLLRPWTGRWATTLKIAERSVVDAVPVTILVGFLVGLILAFQSAMVMQLFGVDIFVADLVGLAIIRELGALLTAIVLTGRSGSAFSSELASMKTNQEIDAMVTMGLSPVKNLALPRIVALTFATPILTVLGDMAGLLGGNVVMVAIGHPVAVFWKELSGHLDLSDIFTGFFKSFVFGFTVALVGCQRGLFAGSGPSDVGEATTLGVVTNIILIAILDSLFAVLFYVLDW
ncbi:MAG: ABC transporter permease [Deltaproteobacteria bacterium]|jgi:phospholipid/cholesterol/gamma-HCH transport system permease protein|nr:ABC transporter permease [Deltaproteobacteria bacterium]